MTRRRSRPVRRQRGGRGARGNRGGRGSRGGTSGNSGNSSNSPNRTTRGRGTTGRSRASRLSQSARGGRNENLINLDNSPGNSVPISSWPSSSSWTTMNRPVTCSICRGIISNLCITNCNHPFCRDCITRWTRASITCPICRTPIHTIRHILPDGGTEIIQISRAELMAHKVGEIYGVLMLLFTAMSHSMLPEVSNYLEQLDQIARDLNVATTSSRLHAAAEQAGQSTGSQNDDRTSNPTSTGQRPAGSVGISPPATLIIRARSLAQSQQAEPMSEITPQSSSTGARSDSPRLSNLGSTPAPSSTASPASSLSGFPTGPPSPATSTSPSTRTTLGTSATSARPSTSPAQTPTTGGTNSAARQASATSQVGGTSPVRMQTTQATTPTRTNSSSTPSVTPPMTPPSSRRAPSPPRIISNSSDSGFGSLIRHTYENNSNRRQQATGGSPVSSRIEQARSRSVTPPPSSPLRSPQTNHFGEMPRGPTAAEAQRTQEQRDRDIAFLIDSYNKINQVREVLLIMHMVIHRNQVELELPESREATDNSRDSDL